MGKKQRIKKAQIAAEREKNRVLERKLGFAVQTITAIRDNHAQPKEHRHGSTTKTCERALEQLRQEHIW
jgi:hypothetical protein